MNDEDKSNLRYLLTLPKDEVHNFVMNLSEDDLNYALALVETFRLDVLDSIQEEVSLGIESYEGSLDSITRDVLNKFTLKK
jgi:hypothetical protein